MLASTVIAIGRGAQNEPSSYIFSALTDHDVIKIDGNDDFNSTAASEGWNGSGIPSDPFIIENYSIDAEGDLNCIKVINTTVHFIVRNCSLTNVSRNYTSYGLISGVYLFNCSGVFLQNISITNAWYGISVVLSSNVSMDDIQKSKNYGIFIASSGPNITVENCNFFNMGIGIESHVSTDLRFINNIINDTTVGMQIVDCRSGYVKGNNIYCNVGWNTYGISMTNSSAFELSFNIISDSIRSILVFQCDSLSIHDCQVTSPNTQGQSTIGVYLIESSDCQLERLEIYNSNGGISLRDCQNLSLRWILTMDCGYGIGAYWVSNLTLERLTIRNGWIGLSMNQVSDSSFRDLHINSPTTNGIRLSDAINCEFNDIDITGYTEIGLLCYWSMWNTFDDIRIGGSDIGIIFEECSNNNLWNSEIQTIKGEALILTASVQNNFVHNKLRSGDPITSLRIGPGSYSNEFYSNHLFNGGLTFTNPYYKDGIDRELYESQYVEISNTYEGKFIIYLNGDDMEGDFLTTSYGQIFVINSTNVSFRDQNIYGAGTGITIIGSRNIHFYSSLIYGYGDYNIIISGSNDIRFSGCSITGSKGAGIAILDSTDIGFRSIQVYLCEIGILGHNSDNVSMGDFIFNSINITAFLISESEHWNISITSISDSKCGIKFENTSNSVVYGCYFERLHQGVSNQFGSNISITRNTFKEIDETAVILRSMSECWIQGNFIHTANGGIYTVECVESAIFDNTIDNATNGIDLKSTTFSDIRYNTFQDSYRGLQLDHSRSNRVSYNLFLRNSDYAIYCTDSWANTFWHNSFLRNNGVDNKFNEDQLQVFDDDDDSFWYDVRDGGNYYSDMMRPDYDDDGFIDIYYKIDGRNEWDRKPLTFSPVDIIAPPLNLKAHNGSHRVMLTWSEPPDIIDGAARGFEIYGYNIYRSETPDNFRFIDLVVYPFTTYDDHGVFPGKVFYYQVRAHCYVGVGGVSNIASGYADETEPRVNILEPKNDQWFNTRDVLVTWEGSDPESDIIWYSIRWTHGDWIDVGNNTSYLLLDLPSGDIKVDVKGYNSVGMFTMDTVSFFIDVTDPNISMDRIGPYTNILLHVIRWKAEDEQGEIKTTEYRLNRGEWVETDLEFAEVFFVPGENTFELRVFDLAGNMDRAQVSITYDGDDPFFNAAHPDPDLEINTRSNLVELSWSCEDQISGIDRYMISMPGGLKQHLKENTTGYTLDLGQGRYEVQLTAWDLAGNNASVVWHINVDKTYPIIVSYFPKGGMIPVDTNISVVFSEEMIVGSVLFEVEDLSGLLTWEGNRLIFHPHQLLEFGRTYKVYVSGADLSSNFMTTFFWEFSTLPSSTIRGRVLGERSKPLFDAIITLQNGNLYYTDNQGRFGIEIPPGSYTLTIEKKGYEIKTIEVTVHSGMEENLGNIRLEKESTVSNTGMIAIISIITVLILSILIVALVIVVRRRKRSMDFYVVEGEPVEKRRTVVEFEEDDQYENEFEIIDFNGSPDFYSVLGVDRYASPAEIKRAYRDLAYMYHPDKLQAAGIDMSIQEIHVMMRELNEAKDTLMDPMRRQAYDITLLDRGL